MTDNGPQFTSEEFQKFSATYQLEHTTSSPYHHQSNGKAESAVKQAKRLLRTCDTSGNDVYLALLAVRNTPQTTHNTSPAQRMLNRRTKTPLPIGEQLLQPTINPHADECIRERQARQRKYYDHGARHLSPLKDGEAVRLQPTQIGTKIWKKGKVLRKVGIRSYEANAMETFTQETENSSSDRRRNQNPKMTPTMTNHLINRKRKTSQFPQTTPPMTAKKAAATKTLRQAIKIEPVEDG